MIFIDPYRCRATGHGCDCCGAQMDTFWAVEHYLLPHSVIRKRHKDKRRMAVYCRRCYEAAGEYPVRVGQQVINIVKGKLPLDGRIPGCLVCGEPSLAHGTLYGMLNSTLMMSGSGIESVPLALLCAGCAEKYDVG